MEQYSMKVIAHIETDFPTKFGIPRQSGLVDSLVSRIVFEKDYRREGALRGIEDFSHLWLVFVFSAALREDWSPTVRPPRLGGNTRMGVFATRSPFRPNPIGLSSVRLVGVAHDEHCGDVLLVAGADLMNGTPILDIKPYLPYADVHPDALGGFTDEVSRHTLKVDFHPTLLEKVPQAKRQGLIDVLACDPRPSYQSDPERRYGFTFAHLEIGFYVDGDTLRVASVSEAE